MDMKPEQSSQSERQASFRQFAEELVEVSKRMFLRDKTHAQIFFFFGEDGDRNIMPAPVDVVPDELAARLKAFIHDNPIYGLVHVLESWTYFPTGATDHTMKQIQLGEIRVSELQDLDRREALVVMAETRDGYKRMWMSLIKREGDQVALGPTLDFTDSSEGCFTGLFDGRT
jgi:hypothetical protein